MDVFAALADPVRRSLLRAIAAAPSRVVDLAAGRPISRPAVSKHLRVLSEAGLVRATAQGRERRYSLDRDALAPVADLLAELAGPRQRLVGEAALDALDTEVRRTSRQRRADTRPASTEQPHEETG